MKNIYVCGPTVYSEVHIGNMRPIITFDIFNRSLRFLGNEINFIHNVTDIDDKIITKANDENTTEKNIAEKYENDYKDLLKIVNVVSPNEMPRVTDSIKEIVDFIETLVEKDFAYEVNGNVYFSIKSIPEYGHVSKRDLDSMRYEADKNKKHPGDFALWKNTTKGIKFDSPWGLGRPGWHTECAVFIDKYTKGNSLDIHGGGIDLLFPHHENEEAQYIAYNSKTITKEWRHIGHVNLNGSKMSKSLGNIFNAREFIKMNGVDTLRMIFLTTSYSAPIDISTKSIEQAKEQVNKFRKIYYKSLTTISGDESFEIKKIAKEISLWHFSSAMKSVNEIVKTYNKDKNTKNGNTLVNTMKLLGFSFTNKVLSSEELELFDRWERFRVEKKYEKADEVRKVLLSKDLI